MKIQFKIMHPKGFVGRATMDLENSKVSVEMFGIFGYGKDIGLSKSGQTKEFSLDDPDCCIEDAAEAARDMTHEHLEDNEPVRLELEA